jgi:hypothetical protein
MSDLPFLVGKNKLALLALLLLHVGMLIWVRTPFTEVMLAVTKKVVKQPNKPRDTGNKYRP